MRRFHVGWSVLLLASLSLGACGDDAPSAGTSTGGAAGHGAVGSGGKGGTTAPDGRAGKVGAGGAPSGGGGGAGAAGNGGAPAVCDFYASPTGSGDGTSPASPFQIQNFWDVVTPGKSLCLLDGTYQGDANMINPPWELSGADGQPITITAQHDGGALLDGEFARTPVALVNNNWFVLDGFSAK